MDREGSYSEKHVLEYINRLPTIAVACGPSKEVILTFDDYSAHLPPEFESALFQKGYFLIHIGGGVKGDVQVNGTTYHKDSKAAYTVFQKEPPHINLIVWKIFAGHKTINCYFHKLLLVADTVKVNLI